MWLTTLALAHVGLEEPPPRYPSDGMDANKDCPCGVGDNGRLCDVPGDRSDPDRSDDVSVYAPGETITMVWREAIGHAGRWRVAFDPDGADMRDFNNHILLDIPDPDGDAGNVGQGNLWQVEVTLPNETCDNCTLQLVQMMDGDTSTPVGNPIGRSSYYQCADIVITGAPAAYTDKDRACGCRAAPGPVGAAWLLPLLLAWRRRSMGHRDSLDTSVDTPR